MLFDRSCTVFELFDGDLEVWVKSLKMVPSIVTVAVSVAVSEIFQCLKNDVTLKPGLEVVQGHWKWCRSIDCIRVPVVVVFSKIIILLEVNGFKKV